jgi:transaldolase
MSFDPMSLNVKIFSDGANLEDMCEMAGKTYIAGLTTNPTLMKNAGISDYSKFAKEVLTLITTKPISFEVFTDDLEEMKRQALTISSWGDNVYVKIPITNTLGQSTKSVVEFLVGRKVKVNVTAIMTLAQVSDMYEVLNPQVPSFVSIFAGRIADTGQDPMPLISNSLKLLSENQNAEVIWASPRELLNVFQANQIGCHIITATNQVLDKIHLVGKDLSEYSLETVKMFQRDAESAGYDI